MYSLDKNFKTFNKECNYSTYKGHSCRPPSREFNFSKSKIKEALQKSIISQK
jgi:hypothetical protein